MCVSVLHSCWCPHVRHSFISLWGEEKKIGGIRTAGSDVFFPPWIKPGGWWFSLPTRCLFCPSVCMWIIYTVKRPSFNGQEAPTRSVICANYILYIHKPIRYVICWIMMTEAITLPLYLLPLKLFPEIKAFFNLKKKWHRFIQCFNEF